MNISKKLQSIFGRWTRLSQPLPLLLALSIFPAVVAITGSGPCAYAQNGNATIRGVVLDSSRALVPNAQITVASRNTKIVVFQGQSDSEGAFVVPQVVPGSYQVTATASGLKTTTVDNLTVSVSQVASIEVQMEVGSVTEQVVVTIRGEELDRSTSNISTLLSPVEVQSIPLQSRNSENLLTFVPGVTHGGSATQVTTSQLSINGSRTLNTEFLLNGTSVIIASTGTPAQLPSPDGIDELRLLTSTAPAEYGRTSGAVLAANTRSGTNDFHGSAYFLIRNEAANANSYFNKMVSTSAFPNGQARPKDRFFQPGGSIGGPVRIPHLYDGRNRTFFFVNYDRTLRRNPNSVTTTVPTPAQRNGDFSAVDPNNPNHAAGATLAAIINPATGTQFPNNHVTGIDPSAALFVKNLPLPNTPGTPDAANARSIGNYFFQQTTTTDILRFAARGDQQFGAKGHLALNYYRLTSVQPLVVTLGSPLLNTNYDCNCSYAYISSINYTHTFTPTLVMDLNFGFFRNSTFRIAPSQGLNVKQNLGISSLPLDQTPTINISGGFANMGGDANTAQSNITNTFAPYGSVTKIYRSHTLKAGASFRKNQFNTYNPSGYPNGNFAFTGEITSSAKSGGNPNNAFADFLLGKIKTGSYQLPMPKTGRRNYYLGLFLQDDFRVSKKLTLNAGVRWEYESAMTIANDIYTRFDPNTGNLLAANINASKSLNINTPKFDLAPRIGFAYSLTDKTVLRGGFGNFYGVVFPNLGGQIAYPGYDVTTTYNGIGTGIAQPFSLSQGFPLTAIRDLKNPFAALTGSSAANPFSISGVEFDQLDSMPMVQQYNVGIQQKIPLGLTFELNYVGNRSIHLPTTLPVNIVPLSQVDAVTLANTTTAVQNAKPYPTLGTWTVLRHVGNANYNSLQASVRRQFNTSLAILANYTWSKNLDDGSAIYNFSTPSGQTGAQYAGVESIRKSDYAVSSMDERHVANIALVYTSNFGPKYLRGFRIAPSFVGHTGTPVNITQSGLVTNNTGQRPNGVATGLKVAPYKTGTAIQYLQSPLVGGNPNPAFPLTPTGPQYATINNVRTRIVSTALGNLPRNAITVPGEVELDLSISKIVSFGEKAKFELRADAFNLPNHTNLGAPNVTLSNAALTAPSSNGLPAFTPYFNSSSFGQITSAQPARQLQLTGRLQF